MTPSHAWLLILFVRPVAYNHPYQNPVVEVGYHRTYADCSITGRAMLKDDDKFEEFGCVPRHFVEEGEVLR